MIVLRPFAGAFVVALVLLIVGGYTRIPGRILASTPSGAPESRLLAASAPPKLGPGTASGSLTTTGTINDTWSWHPGDSVD